MHKHKKIAAMSFILALGLGQAQAEECEREAVRDAAAKSASRIATEIAKNYIAPQEQSLVDLSCMETILEAFNGSISGLISLSLPSIDSIFEGLASMACNAALTGINGVLSDLNSGGAIPFGIGGLTYTTGENGMVVEVGINPLEQYTATIPGVDNTITSVGGGVTAGVDNGGNVNVGGSWQTPGIVPGSENGNLTPLGNEGPEPPDDSGGWFNVGEIFNNF